MKPIVYVDLFNSFCSSMMIGKKAKDIANFAKGSDLLKLFFAEYLATSKP